jgi:hypothetical protein
MRFEVVDLHVVLYHSFVYWSLFHIGWSKFDVGEGRFVVKGQRASGLYRTMERLHITVSLNSDSHLYEYYFGHHPFPDVYLSVIWLFT